MTIEGNAINITLQKATYTVLSYTSGVEYEIEKSFSPATSGRFTVYLCDELVDLGQEVVLTVNGKEAFRGIPEADLKYMVNSCATFFDPQRVYPAAVEVDLSAL